VAFPPLIAIASMTLANPAQASGTVTTTKTYFVSGSGFGNYVNAATPAAACDMDAYWPGYTAHAVATLTNAALQIYQCTLTYLANTNLPSSYWGRIYIMRISAFA
jgi:hypothetical protein